MKSFFGSFLFLVSFTLVVPSANAFADSCSYTIHIHYTWLDEQVFGQEMNPAYGELDAQPLIDSTGSRLFKCNLCLQKLRSIPLENRTGTIHIGQNGVVKKTINADLSTFTLSAAVMDGSEWGIMCDAEFGKKFLVNSDY